MKLAAVLVACGCATSTAPAPVAQPIPSVARAVPTRGAVQIAVSEGSACARMVDGTIRCWGENTGDGTREEHHTPVEVKGVTGAVDLMTMLAQTCAKRSDGQVVCWGSSGFVELDGIPEGQSDSLLPARARALDNAERFWPSDHGDGCARWHDGTTKCWGMGPGTLATGRRSSNGPMPVIDELAHATQYSLSEAVGCARMADGTAMCWGRNDSGQIGDGTTTLRFDPVLVKGLTHVAQVATGRDSACARKDDGTVWCWGDNHAGQLGDGTTVDSRLAKRVPGVTDVVDLVAGELHTCALRRDATLECWGWNNHGQCGQGTETETAKPVRVVGLDHVLQVAATWTHTCALRDDGEVFCWGQGWRGVIGDGMQISRNAPTQVRWSLEQRASAGLPAGVHVDSIAVSFSHTCAVLSDRSVRCWGDNSVGQVTGAGKAEDKSEPIIVPTRVVKLPAASALSLELFRSAARLADGRIALWGPKSAVEILSDVKPVDALVARAPITCARRGDTVTCNNDGKPITVAKATHVSLEHMHACALLADHTVACAGINFRGQLGDGTRTDRWAFALVPKLTNVAQVEVGTEHTCARKLDGTVWCWGEASAVGRESRDNALVPIQVAGVAKADLLAVGDAGSCVRTQGGAVYCWGRYGSYSMPQSDYSAVAVEVPWLAGAKQLALGANHSCLIRADGQAACWGTNRDGELGDGTMTDRSEPVLVRW